ncbi:MAG: hypothetical protein J6P40_11395, partial [Oscillospiraceae bacterium]|nr:hypothetical protein [Oscillospiraceae bacterium]
MTGVLVLVLLTYTIAAGENLLKNPSFEDTDGNGLPSGWIPDAYVMEEGYTLFSVTEDDSVDGQKAVMIRNIGDNDARFKQQVSVEPEELYRFSGYIRTQKVEGGRGANFSIEGLYTFSESIFDSSDGWQYIEWYGETGEDQTEVTLYARLGGYSGESRGTAWFDDLKLEKVNTVPEEKIASRWYQEHTISYYDDEEETESGTAFSAWPLLIILSLFYTVIAILVMQKLRKDQYDLEDNGKKIYVVFYSGLAIALVVRLILSS